MVGGAVPWCSASGAAAATLGEAFKFFAAAQCLLTHPWPEHAENLRNGSCFDFVIVGGGTAGSVLAARLAEEPKFRVLLVEAGGDPPHEAIIPSFSSALIGSEYDWNFTSANDRVSSQGLVDGRQFLPTGKMLGGTGSLNDMVYSRGFPTDYNEWATTLGDDWKWENVLEYFKKTEHFTDERAINDHKLADLHGTRGEIEVGGLNESTFTTDKFMDAFKEIGFQIVKDMTNPDKIGAGRHSHTIRNGRRDSSLTALLNKAADKSNLFVLKNTFVTKILISNKTAYGIAALSDDEEYHFYAKKEVIITAGTFNTPKLLMLSGIGPKSHLNEVGINVLQNLPVGDNLQDHVMVLNYIAANNGTCYSSPRESSMNIIRYLYDQTGPFSYVNTMAAYMAVRGSAHSNVPDFAFYPSCMPMGSQFYESCKRVLRLNANICKKLDNLLKDHEIFSIATVLLNPKSRGRVRLRSTKFNDNPTIYSGTFNDTRDLDSYPEAIAKVRALVETKYFKSKEAKVVDLDVPGCDGKVDEELEKCKVLGLAMSAWHSVGTAAMGSVVDSQLRVMGVEGLRVADASVMPTVIRGNPNAPVIMIAEKAADYIKADYRCNSRPLA